MDWPVAHKRQRHFPTISSAVGSGMCVLTQVAKVNIRPSTVAARPAQGRAKLEAERPSQRRRGSHRVARRTDCFDACDLGLEHGIELY